MANFYQEPNPTNDPNYTRDSKEPERIRPLEIAANTSVGKLFEDAGKTLSVAGPVIKNLFEENIKDDAHKLIDPIMDQHGTNLDLDSVKAIAGTGAKGRVRAAQMAANRTTGDPDDAASALPFAPEDAQLVKAQGVFSKFDGPGSGAQPKPLPPGAQQEIDNLERMKKAYNAGNLSDSYYDAQLVAVSKQLRNKYAGWRDEVDSAISGITGIQPANALRSSLQRDIQYNQMAALQGQSAEQKFRDKYRPEIAAMGYDPDKTPIETLRPAVSDYIGKREILHAKQLRADVGSPEAEATLADTLGAKAQTSLGGMGTKIQGQSNYEDFVKKAHDLAAKGGGTPKEIDDLVNQMQMSRNQLATEMQATAMKPIEGRGDGHSMVTLVKDGTTKLPGIISAQLKPWDDAIAMVKTGNFSALESLTNQNKLQNQTDMAAIYKQFPMARVASGINSAFPNNPLAVNRFTESILPSWNKAVKDGIGNAILNGSDKTPAPTPSEAVKASTDAAAARGTTTNVGTVSKETLKQYDLVTSKENKNVDNAAHVAKQFFNDQKYWDSLSDRARMTTFMTMASPNKSKFIDELSAKDPEVKTAQVNWAKYAAGDIWRRNSADLQDMIQDKKLTIKFNPDTMRFEDHTDYKASGGLSTYENFQKNNQWKINSINNAMLLLSPIVGNDPKAIFGALGIDPSAAKEDNLVEAITKAAVKKGGQFLEWADPNDELGDIKSGRKTVK